MTQRDEKGRFPPGVSGNPGGYPTGKRNRLFARYFDDLYDAWESRGAEAIQRMIDEDPGAFVKVVASLSPKDLTLATLDTNGEPVGITVTFVQSDAGAVSGQT